MTTSTAGSTRTLWRRGSGIAAGLSAALVISACSGGSDGQTVTGANDLITSFAPAEGGVASIKWNLSAGEPTTLDPANAADYSSGQVVMNLCDALLTIDADYNLKPNLATYDQVSDTQLVLKIREGVTFWNGKPLTAEDVAYSLNRASEPDKIISFAFLNVRSIEVTSQDEVTIDFTKPDALFLKALANITGVVMEKGFTEQAGDKLGSATGGVMCSGPFKLDSWKVGSEIQVSRNDAYWNPERRPFASDVTFSFVTDGTALAQALSSGEIDGAYEIPASAIPALQKSTTGRVAFGPSMQGLNLNVANPGGTLGDLKLREAFQRIVDRDAIAKAVFHGAAAANYTALTPATWPNDYKAIYQEAYDKIKADRSYDVAAGKKLVDESGYDGTPIVVAINAGDDTMSRTAQLLQQDAKKIGLTLEIETLQPLIFVQAGYDSTRRKGIDLLMTTNFNGTQNPLEPMGFTYLPDQVYNYTNYNDPEVVELLSEARNTLDGDAQARLVTEAQVAIEEDSSVIPIVSTNTVTYLADELTGAITSFAYWSMPQMAFVGAAK
jgi:peptide/nickel transport system substrate-binding protein